MWTYTRSNLKCTARFFPYSAFGPEFLSIHFNFTHSEERKNKKKAFYERPQRKKGFKNFKKHQIRKIQPWVPNRIDCFQSVSGSTRSQEQTLFEKKKHYQDVYNEAQK